MHYQDALRRYMPKNPQEEAELTEMLRLIDHWGDAILTRDCALAHMTASAFVVNENATKILFAYHNLFDAWAWLGGHADGESDLLALALRELEEETGLTAYHPLTGEIDSVEILPVWAHARRGVMVPSHLHVNVSYLVVGQEGQPLRHAEGENQAVAWLDAARMMEFSGEAEMEPTYQKLLALARQHLRG